MSDQMLDPEVDVEEEVAPLAADTIAEGEVVATEDAEEEGGELDEFVGDFEAQNVPDLATVIKLVTSGGDEKFIMPDDGQTGMTAGEAIVKSGISIQAQYGFELWLNAAKIKITDFVPVGSTLMVVASVKGG